MNRSNALAGRFFRLLFLLAAGLLAACGGGDGEPVPTYTIGFTVSGSQGSVLLARNNSGDDLVFAGDGSYTFATPLVSGSAYSVTVPAYFFTPGQTCVVTNGAGSVANANVTSVRVDCGTAPQATSVVPRFLFVTGENRGGAAELGLLRAYAVNAQTGALTLTDSIGVPEEPYLPLVHPSGRFVYVMPSVLGAGLSSFRIDEASGQFTRIAPDIDVGGAGTVFAGSMDPLGRFLLLGQVYPIDPVSGALTAPAPGVDGRFGGVQAVDPSGRFVYSTEGNSAGLVHYSIDPVTFALTRQSTPQAAGARPQMLAIDPAARFVHVLSNGAQGAPDTIISFRADLITGALTLANPGIELASRGATSMAMHPSGRFLLVANSSADTLSLYSVDRDSGSVSKSGPDIAAGDGPLHVVFDPSGTLAYVTNALGHTLSSYGFDAASGVLAPRGEQATQRMPIGIAISAGALPVVPEARFLFVANTNGGTLSTLAIDPATGALSNSGSALNTGRGTTDLVVHPSGRFVFAPVGESMELRSFAVDRETGALTPLGAGIPIPLVPKKIAMRPDGAFLYLTMNDEFAIGSVQAYAIDSETGALSEVGALLQTSLFLPDVVVEPNGRFAYLYETNLPTTAHLAVLRIDPGTGELSMLGEPFPDTGLRPRGMAFDPAGRFAYVSAGLTSTVQAYAITPGTGMLVAVGAPVSAGAGPASPVMHPTGRFLYMASPGAGNLSIFAVDTASGVLTPLASGPAVVQGSEAVVISPDGAYLYLASYQDSMVQTYRVDSTNGALTAAGVLSVPLPWEIALSNGFR